MTNKTLDDQLRRLAEFAPCPWPVVSLYLSAQPNERGQAQFAPWLRKELSGLRRTFPPNSENSKSFEQDVQRIETWLAEQLQPATHGVALFACAYADGFFEAIQLNARAKNVFLAGFRGRCFERPGLPFPSFSRSMPYSCRASSGNTSLAPGSLPAIL